MEIEKYTYPMALNSSSSSHCKLNRTLHALFVLSYYPTLIIECTCLVTNVQLPECIASFAWQCKPLNNYTQVYYFVTKIANG